jgi:hypothetical protein
MSVARIAGCGFLAAGCALALRMAWLDQRLQEHRAPGVPRAAYAFVPVRWQRRLYTEAGQPLVGRAWRTLLAMDLVAVVALLLLMAE